MKLPKQTGTFFFDSPFIVDTGMYYGLRHAAGIIGVTTRSIYTLVKKGLILTRDFNGIPFYSELDVLRNCRRKELCCYEVAYSYQMVIRGELQTRHHKAITCSLDAIDSVLDTLDVPVTITRAILTKGEFKKHCIPLLNTMASKYLLSDKIALAYNDYSFDGKVYQPLCGDNVTVYVSRYYDEFKSFWDEPFLTLTRDQIADIEKDFPNSPILKKMFPKA